MQVNLNSSNYELFSKQNRESVLQNENKEKLAEKFKKLSQDLGGAKGLTQSYFISFQMSSLSMSDGNFGYQSFAFELGFKSDFLSTLNDPTNKIRNLLKGVDLSKIGYKGKPIADLSQSEAKALVSEDGFFGVKNTAQRIADFVLIGAGDDLDRLKAGKSGAIAGFKQAEQMWGGKLPEIAYETIQKTIDKIDGKITQLGGNRVDVEA